MQEWRKRQHGNRVIDLMNQGATAARGEDLGLALSLYEQAMTAGPDARQRPEIELRIDEVRFLQKANEVRSLLMKGNPVEAKRLLADMDTTHVDERLRAHRNDLRRDAEVMIACDEAVALANSGKFVAARRAFGRALDNTDDAERRAAITKNIRRLDKIISGSR
jgi:hypothetical protein